MATRKEQLESALKTRDKRIPINKFVRDFFTTHPGEDYEQQ